MTMATNLFLFGFIVFCSASMFSRTQADPTLCSRVYNSSGPISMLHTPECSYLKYIDPESLKTYCRARSLLGQDLAFCPLHLTLPLPAGEKGTEEVDIIGSAVFSQNNGTGAIHKAYHLEDLMDYFSIHTQLLAQEKQFSGKIHDPFHLGLFTEALIRTAKDANAVFSLHSHLREVASSSIATITLSVSGHILVAHIGHSNASVWSMKLSPWGEYESSSYSRFYTEARKGNFSVSGIKDISFVESSGSQILVIDALVSTRCDPDRAYWIDYAFELAANSIMGLPEDQLAGNFSAGFIPCVGSLEKSEQTIITSNRAYGIATFQVIDKMSMGDALWEEGPPAEEFLVGTVVTRDDLGNLAAVVVPIQNLMILEQTS